jgi:predicted phosphodiesterase
VVEAAGARIYVLHNARELAPDSAAEGCQAVVSGHSHKASQTLRGGVLYLNPGSAGPRRFRLPVTLARLRIRNGALSPEIVTLG